MFGVGRDLCGSSSPTLLPKQGSWKTEEEPGQGAQVHGRGLGADKKVYGGEEEPCFAFFLTEDFVGGSV